MRCLDSNPNQLWPMDTSNTEHSARLRLKEWQAQIPTIWREVEKERRQWRPGVKHRPADLFIPRERAMAAWRRACDAQGIEPAKEEYIPVMANITQGLAAWRMTQGIYRFDPTLYHCLIDTPVVGDIPGEVLRRMPEWCVYIETPGLVMGRAGPCAGGPISGLWYWISENPIGAGEVFTPHMMIGMDRGQAGKPVDMMFFSLDRLNLEAACGIYGHDGTSGMPVLDKETTRCLSAALSLILFLCSHTAEIQGKKGPGNPTPRKTRQGERMFAPNGPTVWSVGTRLGSTLRAAYAQADATDASGGPGHGRRPHIRRAHWHTFLSGPRDGERRRELRWLPPIPVNLEDYDALPAVIHNVGDRFAA